MMKKFKRTKEDFKCQNCGFFVAGNGYTNHCPKCLWSRHVDVNPGDRMEVCRGMMEPVGIEEKSGNYLIVQKCLECDLSRRVRRGKDDDIETMIKLLKVV